MKSILAACIILLIPALAVAQTPPPLSGDDSTKAKPIEPVLARNHSGPGRIGVRLAFVKDTGLPQIVGMTRGGPAADYGLQIGDIIIKIDKNFSNTLTQEEIKLSLHGEPGTGVELTVQRGDDPRYVVRSVERRLLPTNSEDVLVPMVVENKP